MRETGTNGLITFRLGSRDYATALCSVREVVRLVGLADLPGMTPPLAGVLDLRGVALPVMDLRTGEPAGRGDVLVCEGVLDDGVLTAPVGIAVDAVQAVVGPDELVPTDGPPAQAGVLPGYVLDVLRGPAGPVFLVDLPRMLRAVGAHRPAASAVPLAVAVAVMP